MSHPIARQLDSSRQTPLLGLVRPGSDQASQPSLIESGGSTLSTRSWLGLRVRVRLGARFRVRAKGRVRAKVRLGVRVRVRG